MVKLAWFNQGKEFRPRILIADVEEYEKSEKAWLGTPTSTDLLRIRQRFVETVLGRHIEGAALKLELTAVDVNEGFVALWRSVFPSKSSGEEEPAEEPVPLE